MGYLIDLGFTEEELNNLNNKIDNQTKESLSLFPKIVAINYTFLKDIGVTNIKEVLIGHSKMFLLNPDQFKSIFVKYDQADLIRCIEKNAAIVEQL